MVKKRGYTLVEIMTVMGMIGVLSATSFQVYHRSSLNAREAVLRQQLQQVRDALDRCYADTGLWPDPSTLDDATAPAGGWVPNQLNVGWGYTSMDASRWQGPYLKKFPEFPAVTAGSTREGSINSLGPWTWNSSAPATARHAFRINSTAVSSNGTQYFTW